jgi:hypothetical protein
MDINHEQLEQLLICINTKCSLQDLISSDARFGVRLQQTIRGCLGATTKDTERFMESAFGKDSMTTYREARRRLTEPLYRAAGVPDAPNNSKSLGDRDH